MWSATYVDSDTAILAIYEHSKNNRLLLGTQEAYFRTPPSTARPTLTYMNHDNKNAFFHNFWRGIVVFIML